MTDFPHDWIPAGTAFAAESGSVAYGLNTADSDMDLLGVFVEPREFVTGVRKFDSIRRNTAGATQGQDNRSTKDDIDLALHGLRKFALGVGAGNPNLYVSLFFPHYEVLTDTGRMLLADPSIWFSRQVPIRFLGYLSGQRAAMTGEAKPGKRAEPLERFSVGMKFGRHSIRLGLLRDAPETAAKPRVQRSELVEAHGFDVKYAYHTIRLGFQGLEATRTGRITMPFTGEQKQLLLDIRAGKVPLEEILDLAKAMESDLQHEIKRGGHRENADWGAIGTLLDEVYEQSWATVEYDESEFRENIHAG